MTTREERMAMREKQRQERQKIREARIAEREAKRSAHKNGHQQSKSNRSQPLPTRQITTDGLPKNYNKIKLESISKVQNKELIELAKSSKTMLELYRKVKTRPNLRPEYLYLVGLMSRTDLRRMIKVDKLQLSEESLQNDMKTFDEKRHINHIIKELTTKYLYVFGSHNTFEYIKALELPGITRMVEDPNDMIEDCTVLIFGKGKDPQRFQSLQKRIQDKNLKFVVINDKNLLAVKRSDFIRRINDVWKV